MHVYYLGGRKLPSKAICEEDDRGYKKKSGRIVPLAGIYRSLPHKMYYEFKDKWVFVVSAVQMTSYSLVRLWNNSGEVCIYEF